MDYYKESLKLHETCRGKLAVVSKVPLEDKDDLSIAYTPGVAEPCREIYKDPELVYQYTSKGNTVAVISDGSAVLGLGNIGAKAAIPVMEGKAVLFKAFADIDAIPICLETQDTEEIIQIVKNIAPTLGGINLEDISAPRCFEIERRLQELVDIPVFHDDQHGTAIVVSAAAINALKLTGKKFKEIKVVINGAGAAGMAIVKMLMALGAEDIIICDTKGILSKSAKGLTPSKQELAELTNGLELTGTLADAVVGRDLFIGVSGPKMLTAEMVRTMAADPVIFAMANPEPEIMPEHAREAGARIIGTGRSDFPNQINNVLAFPGIFKGALSVRAAGITEDMKVAAAYAIAEIIPDHELREDYIIPSVFHPGVADAVAKAAGEAWRKDRQMSNDELKSFRIEHDSIGEIKVEANRLWGAQTQRSLENFKIGTEKMPAEIIRAFAVLKKAAALVNMELGQLDPAIAETIAEVCDEICEGRWDEQFPLAVWQTGSGTQTNMNVNEVIANRGNQILAKKLLHPNDHVNKGQSSNDTFPTAMHIAVVTEVEDRLFPALHHLEETFRNLKDQHGNIIKIGRTHLQDATPLTLGQEIGAWLAMAEQTEDMIRNSLEYVRELALGGTAVGTGLNTHPEFGAKAAEKISVLTGTDFVTASNKFHALTSKDALVHTHGALKALAADLMKIANDVRWLASGPRCGIGELTIPENEPGSSIMPGKVNPTQCEALTMVCCQVMSNDAAVGFAASQGNFQLNVYMPVLVYNMLQSIRLLSDAVESFNDNCAKGIIPNEEKINNNLESSLMLVTALNPHIGYDKAAEIAKTAYQQGLTLKQAAVSLGILTEEEFDRIVDPAKMV